MGGEDVVSESVVADTERDGKGDRGLVHRMDSLETLLFALLKMLSLFLILQ